MRHTSAVPTKDGSGELRRALGAERAARRRLEQIQAVTDAALPHLELDPLLRAVVPRLAEILDVDTAAVLLLDAEAGELVVSATVGIAADPDQAVRIPLGAGLAGRVAAERIPILAPAIGEAEGLGPSLRRSGVTTLLGVPLQAGSELVGVLHVGSLARRDFTEADRELLQLVAGRIAIAIDRARVHEAAVQRDARRLSFVAIASHELRSPASAVYGAVATLRERAGTLSADQRAELEDTLWEQSSRLRRLIEQLLDLSRLDTNAVKIDPRPLVLHRVLAEIAADVDRAGGARQTVLEVDDDLAVVVDPLTIERVVGNLLVNAHRHGRPPVTLAARRSDTHLRITVDDEGEGISEELRERLFERFERGSHDGEGSGLGLAIAKAYARAHGGDVVYEPRAGGTRFELVLPLRTTIA